MRKYVNMEKVGKLTIEQAEALIMGVNTILGRKLARDDRDHNLLVGASTRLKAAVTEARTRHARQSLSS